MSYGLKVDLAWLATYVAYKMKQHRNQTTNLEVEHQAYWWCKIVREDVDVEPMSDSLLGFDTVHYSVALTKNVYIALMTARLMKYK